MAEETNLTNSLKKLEEIAAWFDNQQDVDVEEGLRKVKEAATLIKSSKTRLAAIENEFQTIEKEISSEEKLDNIPTQKSTLRPQEGPTNFDDIRF